GLHLVVGGKRSHRLERLGVTTGQPLEHSNNDVAVLGAVRFSGVRRFCVGVNGVGQSLLGRRTGVAEVPAIAGAASRRQSDYKSESWYPSSEHADQLHGVHPVLQLAKVTMRRTLFLDSERLLHETFCPLCPISSSRRRLCTSACPSSPATSESNPDGSGQSGDGSPPDRRHQ